MVNALKVLIMVEEMITLLVQIITLKESTSGAPLQLMMLLVQWVECLTAVRSAEKNTGGTIWTKTGHQTTTVPSVTKATNR